MTLISSIWVILNPVTSSTQSKYADPELIPPYCLEGKLDFEPYVEAVYFLRLQEKFLLLHLGLVLTYFCRQLFEK